MCLSQPFSFSIGYPRHSNLSNGIPITAVRVKSVCITTLCDYTLYYYPRPGHPRQDLSICVPIHKSFSLSELAIRATAIRVTARQDWPRHGHSRRG